MAYECMGLDEYDENFLDQIREKIYYRLSDYAAEKWDLESYGLCRVEVHFGSVKHENWATVEVMHSDTITTTVWKTKNYLTALKWTLQDMGLKVHKASKPGVLRAVEAYGYIPEPFVIG